MNKYGLVTCETNMNIVLILFQAMVVGLGMDQMMIGLGLGLGHGFGLCSMGLYLDLLETWLGPCSLKVSLDRHIPIFVSLGRH